MRVYTTTEIPNSGIGLSIIEVDDPTAVQFFENRFQLAVVIKGKNILPKSKKKFLSFETNHYLYPLKRENSDKFVAVTPVVFYEKQVCDRPLEDCTTELMQYISMYNQGLNVKKELKKKYEL
jgi:hypothetical protein